MSMASATSDRLIRSMAAARVATSRRSRTSLSPACSSAHAEMLTRLRDLVLSTCPFDSRTCTPAKK
eukprot:10831740-Lingulodinium_polyedra.AAC.1